MVAPWPFRHGSGCKSLAKASIFVSHGSLHSFVYGSSLRISIGCWACCFWTGRGMARQPCAAAKSEIVVDSFMMSMILQYFDVEPGLF